MGRMSSHLPLFFHDQLPASLPAYLCALAVGGKHGVCDVLPPLASVCGVINVNAYGGGAIARSHQHLALHSGMAWELGTQACRSGQWGWRL